MNNYLNGPHLRPPCSGWQEDLTPPDMTPTVEASLGLENPNHICEIYLELSRPPHLARGLVFYLTASVFVMLILLGLFFIPDAETDAVLNIAGTAVDLALVWIVAFGIRVDTAPPRDMPLRFNRARKRIYAYNFEFCWWNPLGRWRVVPVSYDWHQVRAERWMKRALTAHGALIIKWGVVLSIIEPETNNVIDRFPLSTMGADEFAWAYICTYMQQGPSALPPPGPARDHNDVPWYNIALRLAPEVKWPADMDLESRTAS